MATRRSAAAPHGRPRDRADRAGAAGDDALFLLPVLALATIYVGHHRGRVQRADATVAAPDGRAHGPRRRGSGVYLDDPVLLFVPARLLIGASSRSPRRCSRAWPAWTTSRTPGSFGLSMLGLRLAFEHLLPLLIVRRDPERVLTCCCRRYDADELSCGRSRAPWSGSSRRCGASASAPPSERRDTAEDESAGEAAQRTSKPASRKG